MGSEKSSRGAKTVLLVSQCAGISDPFHFYLGYFLPLVGDARLERIRRQPRRVLYQSPLLASLQGWVKLGLALRELDGDALERDVLQEYLRRRRWTSLVVRRDTTLLFPDSDNVHKMGSIQFRRLLGRARRRLSGQGLLGKPIPPSGKRIGRACIMVRANPDLLKPVAFPRGVPNLSEIGEFLEHKGWDVVFVDAAIEAPEVVLKMVSESTLLIGQYGAGLSHSMWLSKGSNVIEISAPSGNPMAPWAYRRLAESGSINFITSMCQSTWTSPASIAEFERAYSEIRSRRWTVFDTMRSVFQAYSHIYIGRILISAGLRKH